MIVPLLELQCKYISAAYFEDNLIVEASLKNATAVKLEFEYAIFREGDEKPLNVGRTLHALVGKDLRPVNVKKEYPELYQKLISAVENESPLLEEKKEE